MQYLLLLINKRHSDECIDELVTSLTQTRRVCTSRALKVPKCFREPSTRRLIRKKRVNLVASSSYPGIRKVVKNGSESAKITWV